jgi:hypothetical protein
MYTLRMSWSFRGLVFGAALVWALAPQLACFLPETTMTESEADCCRQMAGDCGEANMPSHVCCRHVVRSDVATTVKAPRQIDPPVESSATLVTLELPPLPFAAAARGFFVATFHAPPPDPQVSSLTLRI